MISIMFSFTRVMQYLGTNAGSIKDFNNAYRTRRTSYDGFAHGRVVPDP